MLHCTLINSQWTLLMSLNHSFTLLNHCILIFLSKNGSYWCFERTMISAFPNQRIKRTLSCIQSQRVAYTASSRCKHISLELVPIVIVSSVCDSLPRGQSMTSYHHYRVCERCTELVQLNRCHTMALSVGCRVHGINRFRCIRGNSYEQ